MALELTYLDDDGVPSDAVELGMRVHGALMNAAEQLQLRVLVRLGDYFADAEFDAVALPEFLRELRVVQTSTLLDRDGRDVARAMERVAEAAQRRGKSLLAIAD